MDICNLAKDNIEHGNVINGHIIWNDTISDHNLPDSYYLTQKPAFFEELPWPLYGPTEGFSRKLPAQIRFEEGDTPTRIALHKERNAPDVQITVTGYRIQFINNYDFKVVSLYSLDGREILRQNITGRENVTISTNSLSKGIYIIKLSGTRNFTQKIAVN